MWQTAPPCQVTAAEALPYTKPSLVFILTYEQPRQQPAPGPGSPCAEQSWVGRLRVLPGRSSADPLPSHETTLPVSQASACRTRDKQQVCHSCVIPRNGMRRPGPSLVTQTSCHRAHHISPKHRLSEVFSSSPP